ncbi:MAG: ThuA domain-containing protein [Candidatus Nealsonbacteria bacterium]|nr:ThuA domain-containing protein [Candidatus Nealsonbacteria bacterium]
MMYAHSVISEKRPTLAERRGNPVAAMLCAIVLATLLTSTDFAQAEPAVSSTFGQQDAESASPTRVLIVTGEDIASHKWPLTSQVLKRQIEKDERLAVDVLDDLTKLASTNLADYAVVVLHFKNYDPHVPGRTAFDELRQYVEGGGGLVLVHFACGAFQEFKKDFGALAGRVWNPTFRAHDRRGKFRVNMTDVDHVITRGMKSFDNAVDELYTCLDGDAPIVILATAVSKVDQKTYPMAFVLEYGKGRVFHSVLGHDATVFENEGVGQFYRRGATWAAGLELDAIPQAAEAAQE